MQLEFHQLDRRWEHLRVRQPHRQGRLMASLAESGQQTPIVVVLSAENRDRYLVIDGHKRIAALQQLGRDTVEATVWAMSEAEALLLDRSLRFSQQESALEQGWLLPEMERRFGYSLEELARRFDRSVSWVSRRLALVELLPEAIQQQVREGALRAELAMKYLVPVARVDLEHCERMAAAFVQHRCNTRQAGQLYAAWREGSRVVRERILAEPELFLKTQRQPPVASSAAAGLDRELDRMAARIGKEQAANHAEPGATNRDSGTERAGSEQARDRAPAATVAPDRAQSSALELHPHAGNPTDGESRTVPATDPRAFERLQGESRASP
jgi:ParB family chromosome partitioning protein